MRTRTQTLAYAIIAAGLFAAVCAGAFFPGAYCIPLAVLSGGLTSIGVTLAQAEAYGEGREDMMDMEDEE